MKPEQTPYFLFKPKILEKNYKEFEEICKTHLNNFQIAYSVKTNSFQQLINQLAELGSGFETASLNEINLIPKTKKKNKTTHPFTLLNGPCKTQQEIETAIKNKFLINIDSKAEADLIAEINKTNPLDIGLRVSPHYSKFGFDESQLLDIINYCKSKKLNIICLHFHQGTQQNLKEFTKNIKKIQKIIHTLTNQNQLPNLKYLDIGGGFPDKIQLKNLGATLKEYIISIKPLTKFNKIIILEPGRNLVADSFNLITKVHFIKQNFGENYAILDVGINLLPKITLSNYKFTKILSENNLRNNNQQKQQYILAGPLLFGNDILGKFYGDLKTNDIIRVENTGAYCYNLAWEISYSKPKIFIQE